MKWHCQKRNCIIVVCVMAVLLLGSCSLGKKQELSNRNYVAMGTIMSVNLYVEDATQGDETQRLISECLSNLEKNYLSYRMEGSEIWKLNHSNAEAVELSDFLYENLQKVWDISQKSDGALDVTVGEVTGLWNIDTYADCPEGFVKPEADALAAAIENVGYEKITLEQKLTLPSGMSIDLGAVGKGIACDEIRKILIKQEIPAAVISVGGSNVIWGRKDNGLDWMVGVTHPREDGRYLGYLQLEGDCFVATSGDYERFVLVDGERYHHIIDPKTGAPARSGLCGVTIVSDSGLLGDALSTACFVLGKEKGMALAEMYGAEALFVEVDGSITMTDGMKQYWLAEE